jgi:hypothetical protein
VDGGSCYPAQAELGRAPSDRGGWRAGGRGFVLSRPSGAWTGHPQIVVGGEWVDGVRGIPGLKIETWGTRFSGWVESGWTGVRAIPPKQSLDEAPIFVVGEKQPADSSLRSTARDLNAGPSTRHALRDSLRMTERWVEVRGIPPFREERERMGQPWSCCVAGVKSQRLPEAS